jgi:FtsK/SpoIIIE family
MPLINVIRGERIEPAPLHVRPPMWRIPFWLALTWWTVKGLTIAVVTACRYWYLTGPALVLLWLYARYGWTGPLGLLAAVAALGTGWWYLHRPSFLRFGLYPVWSRWRRLGYRRRWVPAMATAKLSVAFDGQVIVPILRQVRTDATADVLTVRMVSGQIPDDFAKAGERLMHTFAAVAVRVSPGRRPDLVHIRLLRHDPLIRMVAPLPVPAVPDLRGLAVAVVEDGCVYRLRLFGTQILVVGATGAGKGSVLWSVIAALAGGIHTGLVKVWTFDPKGGLEMTPGRALFDRFYCDDFTAMAHALDELVTLMRARIERIRNDTRQHHPTIDEPLHVVVIDELATLTAYLTDRQLKDRIKAALGLLLTQGRAAGFHVVAAIQDPRKEVLSFRDLFPTRIALRMTEPAHTDLVLGDGMRDRGALCDRIPMGLPGVAHVVLDGDPTPVRVRFSHWTDADITTLARTYQPRQVSDKEVAA